MAEVLIRVGYLAARAASPRRWVSRDAGVAYPQSWSTTPQIDLASIFEEDEAAAWILAHGDDALASGWGPLWTELFP